MYFYSEENKGGGKKKGKGGAYQTISATHKVSLLHHFIRGGWRMFKTCV